MQAETEQDWKFGTGAPMGQLAPLGGTGMEDKASGNTGSGLSQADQFRFGTGSVAPVPLGGTVPLVAAKPTSETAAALVAAKPTSEKATQRVKQENWPNPADEFRHGTGSVGAGSLGGP